MRLARRAYWILPWVISLVESDADDLFKDPEVLKRFKELRSIGAKEGEHILFTLDSLLKISS